MAVTVYNTLTRKKEELKPEIPGQIRMYVCGPTTYNYIHLGNARPLVVFDTVRRYLEYRGYKVKFIQNFTDIDDKIIKRAQEEKVDPLELAQKYIGEYFKDAEALGVRKADVHPKVSEHIPEIIQLVQKLVDKGHAYVVQGDVYFDVRSFKDYGKLSGRSLDELQAGARVEVDPRKKDPLDFALWKGAKPGEPAWDSPWGRGRPGWHIECSAMSIKYLGSSFDIHGGGFDLIFPHHENELAQSEAATGRPFARYWMHNGFITVNQEKMSKSLGNFFLVRDILQKYPGDVIRFFLLSTHYRSPLDFDDQKLEEHAKALERIKNTARSLQAALDSSQERDGELGEEAQRFIQLTERYRHSLEEAMDDDFNTALAIGIFFDLCRDVNSFLNSAGQIAGRKKALEEARKLFADFAEGILGIINLDQLKGVQELGQSGQLVEGLIQLLLDIRQEARKKKDWQTADAIRDRMKDLGIIIEDTPQGPRWRR